MTLTIKSLFKNENNKVIFNSLLSLYLCKDKHEMHSS